VDIAAHSTTKKISVEYVRLSFLSLGLSSKALACILDSTTLFALSCSQPVASFDFDTIVAQACLFESYAVASVPTQKSCSHNPHAAVEGRP
jgi:hypothetical protein